MKDTNLTYDAARVIVEMEVVCHSEGIGPDSSELMNWIGKEYPELKEEFNYLSW